MDEEKLFLENKGLIYMAIKRMHLFYDTEDEFQEYYDAGVDGLLNGIRTYDETKGFKLSTYLYTCIYNGIARRVYLNTMPKRKNKYGRDLSLNKLVDTADDESNEFGDFIPDPNVNIEKEIDDEIEKERLILAVNQLKNEKDKLVIKMYYGLDGYEELGTYEKVGRQLGISREAVRQKLVRALKNLKSIYEKVNDKEILNKNISGGFFMSEIYQEKPKNNLSSLNDILFEQLNKLTTSTSERLDEEIRKSCAVAQLAQQITNNINTCIKAVKMANDNKFDDKERKLLGIND